MGTLRFFEEVVSFKIRRTFGFADYIRKEGYERLEEEILYLFFLGVWQNDLRHGRAVARAIEQERMDVYELWKRCDRDVSFRREFIRHLATYLEPLTVELPNL